MNHFSRRSFLGTAGAGLAFTLSPLRAMSLPKSSAASTDRLITIFLRGGHDGVHTVVPVGDTTWVNPAWVVGAPGPVPLRPPGFSPAMTLPLNGTSFAELNSDYSVLATTPPGSPFTGTAPDAAGHIAWIHQCGNPWGLRSHFTEQQIYETADHQPAHTLNKEGFVPRVRQVLASSVPQLWGASVSFEFQRMYRSTHPEGLMAHIDVDRLESLRGPTSDTEVRQRLALQQHLQQGQADPLAEVVRRTSTFALDLEPAMNNITDVHDALHFPQNAAEAGVQGINLPASGIGYRLMRDCELALKVATSTSCQVIGVEVGGWDTHQTQGTQRATLDRWLAHALRSLYDLTFNLSEDFTIVVMTEFGRTNWHNAPGTSPTPTQLAAAGTDHGVGGLMTVIGRKVNGGVYNCRATSGPGLGAPWKPGTGAFNLFNAQDVVTDFRAVYQEILQKRFGLTDQDIGVVIPNFAAPFLNFIN